MKFIGKVKKIQALLTCKLFFPYYSLSFQYTQKQEILNLLRGFCLFAIFLEFV